MRQDPDEKLDRLFALARNDQPESPVEFFETRVMARIHERRQNASFSWDFMIWRMIPAFAVITVISAVCSITVMPSYSADMFAAISSGQEEYLAKSYLTGE